MPSTAGFKELMVFLRFTHAITYKSTKPGCVYEPSRKKTNIMASALCIDPDQPSQSEQTNPGRHIPFQIPETENPQEAKSVCPD